ncbi:MAG: OmpW family protein [Hyphomicrobiaceae bacterium]
MKRLGAALLALAMTIGLMQPASAGDYDGNFMVRLQATGVFTQDDLRSLDSTGLGDLKALGFDAEVSDRFLPTATLTYFLNKNLSVELFCCFSKHQVDLKAPIAGLSGEVADAWIFPPALTLQYHITGLGPFKPYLGAGVQYIHFFNEKTGANPINATSVSIDDAFGVTLQAGIDVAIGNGWYLNADIKKSWLDTTAVWRNSVAGDVTAKVDLDPLIVSAGIGYRFNLEDLFGHRNYSQDTLK